MLSSDPPFSYDTYLQNWKDKPAAEIAAHKRTRAHCDGRLKAQESEHRKLVERLLRENEALRNQVASDSDFIAGIQEAATEHMQMQAGQIQKTLPHDRLHHDEKRLPARDGGSSRSFGRVSSSPPRSARVSSPPPNLTATEEQSDNKTDDLYVATPKVVGKRGMASTVNMDYPSKKLSLCKESEDEVRNAHDQANAERPSCSSLPAPVQALGPVEDSATQDSRQEEELADSGEVLDNADPPVGRRRSYRTKKPKGTPSHYINQRELQIS